MRFSGLETTFDPSTVRVLTGVGVTGGWACWEIGAGGGSIARWLADRVGPTGRVLATDIDPRFILPSQLSHLEVARHGVTADAIPPGSLRPRPRPAGPEPSAAAPPMSWSALTQALRPGGWLVIEDFCNVLERSSEPIDAAEAEFRRVHVALADFLARGTDNQSDYATSLPQLLARLGLADVGGEGRLVFGQGGSPGMRVMEAALRQVGDQMIAAGQVDRSALDKAIDYLTNPTSIVSMPLMVSAWGRRK